MRRAAVSRACRPDGWPQAGVHHGVARAAPGARRVVDAAPDAPDTPRHA